ncbi:plasmid replication initiator protein [Micromonospora sp. WMMC415]|uniref:replication initiator n=1 Tax=Micromonospora sp. WMMC415 TaxID=2675222 RepID=UPI0012B45BC8|nr:replication initiator [Micromonospora sp. WMMC415]QGN49246.1 plasmid replication initiator protein [Micromonospora sp. WMMC415]
MAADLTTAVPDQHTTAGPGHRPTAAGSPGAFVGRDESAFARATNGDYFGWLEHVRSAAGCSHPIRLAGEVATIDRATGRLLASVATADLPDGEIYKPCGNRRHTVCPSCARTYQRDAYQLLRAGLAGGKGIPDSVAEHPAVFPTFTAPSFGTVHTRVVKRHTCGNRRRCDCRAEPCHPRRASDPTARPCEHGQATVCWARHEDNDPRLGQPLCLDCYDYDAQVVWNHAAPELWRRTSIAITRHLNARARALGLPRVEQITEAGRVRRVSPVKPSFGKVAEMQRRAVVHYHAVIRLDGTHEDPDVIVPPPAALTVDDLIAAVRHAAATVAFTTRPHPANPAGWHIAWGEQVDVRPINADGEVTDGKVAGYLAKYATKSTEATGHVSRRLDGEVIDLYANHQGTHPERLVDACWTLGGHRDWQQLRRWAHMLGFGGHFLTKSRRYSTTFRILRDARIIWRRTETGHEYADQPDHEDTTLIVGLLSYVGSGWRTTGDALLANTAAAMARERHEIAREEVLAAA